MPNSRKSHTSLTENLQTLVRDKGQRIQSTAKNALDETRQTSRRLSRQMDEMQRSMGKELKGRARRTDRIIHKSPYPVLGASLLAGMLIGIFIGRR